MQGRRGRPPKVQEEPLTDAAKAVSEVLVLWCGINGCMARFHEEEARNIIASLKRHGYIIIKGDE